MCAAVPRIHLLDATLANQIAAGEVIERPAAVVKELIENALDAGGRRIEVDLEEGGRRLVRVRDDGCGMGREDAELSVQRHATSKLRSKDDLFAIASYGFRGEALPSMAAVSRFLLLTCEPDALNGTRVEVEGGSGARIADAGAPAGTTVEVRDLFWNVPARRKFLKKAQTEQAQCLDAVLHLALPRPDVTFIVRDGGRTLLALQAGDASPRAPKKRWGARSATTWCRSPDRRARPARTASPSPRTSSTAARATSGSSSTAGPSAIARSRTRCSARTAS